MLDTRLVQTAVLGNRKSDKPVLMPMERLDALALRAALASRSLWCGYLLGGCGRQLTTKIGRERIPHFAHFPKQNESDPECPRVHTGSTSADHLFISERVKDLLRRNGRKPAGARFEGDFDQGGTCHWITIDLPEDRGVIVVAMRDADISEWEQRDEQLRSSSRWVTWLFGPGMRAPQRLLYRDGFSLHLRFDDRISGRPLHIGTQVLDAATDWIDLLDSQVADYGLMTPYSDRAYCALRELPAPVEPKRPAPQAPPAEEVRHEAPAVISVRPTVRWDGGVEIDLADLRLLLGRIAQRYGFAEEQGKAQIVTGLARSLKTDAGETPSFPDWLIRDIDTALRLEMRRTHSALQPLDPGPTFDGLPLPETLSEFLRDVGWDPTANLVRTRWLKLACMHRSYLHEHTDLLRVGAQVLDMLAEVGKRWLSLAVLDRFLLEQRVESAGEQSQVLAQLRRAQFELLGKVSAFSEAVLLGRGEAQMMDNPDYAARSHVRIDVTSQICGTLAVFGEFDALYEIVRRYYPKIENAVRQGSLSTGSVDWKIGLNQLGVVVDYETVASGPDHYKHFEATVRDSRGRTGHGTGRSRKAAEHSAAEDFLRKHDPRQVAQLIASARRLPPWRTRIRPRTLSRRRYPQEWRGVDIARKLFDLPAEAEPYLNQAFIHSSWIFENKREAGEAGQRDYTLLAHHGSEVVGVLVAQRLAEQVLSTTLTPSPEEARVVSPPERVWRDAFAVIGANQRIFLGKGEQQTPTSAYANVMQALLCVAWRFRGHGLIRDLPPELVEYVDGVAARSIDHYTKLKESCVPFGLEFEEDYKVTGRVHRQSFRCTIRISSFTTAIRVPGPGVASKSLAKQASAKRLLDILERISTADEWRLSPEVEQWAKFLLESQLSQISKIKSAQLARLAGRGTLGVTYLLTDDIEAFAAWAEQVEQLIGSFDGKQVDELHQFYTRCLAESRGRIKKPLHIALAQVCDRACNDEFTQEDRELLDAIHRVVRASLGNRDRESKAVAEALQWAIVTVDRRGGRLRVQQEDFGFSVIVADVEPGELLEPFVPLLRAQFPSITIEPIEDTILIGCEPVDGPRSILQAGAQALEAAPLVVNRRLYEAVWLLLEAVQASEREAIDSAVNDIHRWLEATGG